MAIKVEGLNERQAALGAVMAEIRSGMVEASRDVVDLVVPQIKQAAPHRSGRLGESTRGTAQPNTATIRVGDSSTPYAGPIVYGWPSRPNRRRGWRGGPIAPNPYPYDVLGREGDNIRDRYERYVNRLGERVSD
jgi:hypothetical protein